MGKWLHNRNPADLIKPRVNKNIEIVADLIKRHKMLQAPVKSEYYGTWYEITIPIGKDHTATLLLSDDAMNEIKRVTEK